MSCTDDVFLAYFIAKKKFNSNMPPYFNHITSFIITKNVSILTNKENYYFKIILLDYGILDILGMD